MQSSYKKNKNHIIKVENVYKYYKTFLALKNISFGVTKGKIHGFIGPNGAGKTTTIKSIIGALQFQRGKITISDFPSHNTKAKEFISYIPENARFPTRLNIDTYLLHTARLYGFSKKEAEHKVAENWEKIPMGIEKFRKADPNSLSSGQKKKVYLMQALITNPEVLIMDEPAANLDPDARIEFFNTLCRIRDYGYTVFISSHVLSELNNVVDEITVLEKGRVIFTDDIQKLKFLQKQYIINTLDNKQFIKFIPKKIKTSFRKDGNILAEIEKAEDAAIFYKIAIEKNILLKSMKPNEVNLTEIYSNILKKDSKNSSQNEEITKTTTSSKIMKKNKKSTLKNAKSNFVFGKKKIQKPLKIKTKQNEQKVNFE